MAHRQSATLVSFDADGACDWLLEEAGDELRSVAEYTPDDYTLLYLSEETVAEYGSLGDVSSAGDDVHQYLDLDFREREMFLDLYPVMDSVDGFVTVAEDRAIARVLSCDDEGLYFSTTLDVPVVSMLTDVVSLIEAA